MPDMNDPISLNRPTVLVLGAGASAVYGFPLGTELKQTMLASLNRKTEARISELGFNKETFAAFHESLQYGMHPTIDIFLEHKTNFRELGAYLIASTILPLEKPGNLFPRGNWYSDLYNMLHFENKEPDISNLSIVTLNYDRSFEHFMTKTIDFNVHDTQLQNAHTKRTQVRIIHAHGSLGPYPNVPYGTMPDDKSALREAANSIKIVSDKLDDSPDFHAAQQCIAEAKNIVFLGFGYNERTLDALLRHADINTTRFFGTAYDLLEPKRQNLINRFNGNIMLGSEKQNCSAFLRQIGLVPN